jgi:hypothetical protein
LGQCYGIERRDLVDEKKDEGIPNGPIPEAAQLRIVTHLRLDERRVMTVCSKLIESGYQKSLSRGN